eukprot:TRINITY_DN3749_c0_g1_i1.p1 TRINITY_DN3749_c0_g1~~TRINITY_DN3749_c0_g1_i1.p1  ORF type:complete len:253 (-),score=80.67 TRINITY_DN3749_c0_g1_i1:125-883(-)
MERKIDEVMKKHFENILDNHQVTKDVYNHLAEMLENKDKEFNPKDFYYSKIPEENKIVHFKEMTNFFSPIQIQLRESALKFMDKHKGKKPGLELAIDCMNNYMKNNAEESRSLMKLLGVKKFRVPIIKVNQPVDQIMIYNKIEEDDPLAGAYCCIPDFRRLGIFMDRYDTQKDVLCWFVFSTVDQNLLTLEPLEMKPYPTCWNCQKDFGTLCCGACGVAKYCSKECQVANWRRAHKEACPHMREKFEELVYE